jgi:hypothetical protein
MHRLDMLNLIVPARTQRGRTVQRRNSTTSDPRQSDTAVLLHESHLWINRPQPALPARWLGFIQGEGAATESEAGYSHSFMNNSC